MSNPNLLAEIVEVEIVSANLWENLEKINQAGIPVDSVFCIDEITARFRIPKKDYTLASDMCKRKGDRLLLCRRSGILGTVQSFLKRPILLAVLILLAILTVFLPARIYFVRADGNVIVPERKILIAAKDVGICFGAKRQDVRSEAVKNALLSMLPELQWAGINTVGCTAVISVRERSNTHDPEKSDTGVSSIVAGADGVILSCTVNKGRLLCNVGQAVREGEVLISGYTDCGMVIRACQADGEIYAETMHNLAIVTPNLIYRRKDEGRRKAYNLLIGKKRINLWNSSRIWENSCGRIYEERYLTLPGGFQLPVVIGKETHIQYNTDEELIAASESETLLKRTAEDYLLSGMLAGHILNQEAVHERKNGHDRLNGFYLCTEMIGRSHMEEVGKQNG